ncbi:conserved exported hypothetical protein [Candidatus Nitrospira nitrosa]|uniref:Lipoprotein n=1 Tax=Candidatus Nitrospira nitrosa TaxID=1742972 RepID=A0A0S4LD78_9BACT|nr:hypothetical protein [Candidatus Nitrospira nitrosa]CUS33844.1 conserved exported hypothetical protein [Candidatus Nitrospira nitrosa]
MIPALITCRPTLWLPALLILATSCAQTVSPAQSSQEYLGLGIVSGTLGEQKRQGLSTRELSSTSVVGQVQSVEGAAYLIRDTHGRELRIPHDENTRIDRPAHVGDQIQSWLDHHGRAVLIRSLDGNGRY